jgi:hypothetical protein
VRRRSSRLRENQSDRPFLLRELAFHIREPQLLYGVPAPRITPPSGVSLCDLSEEPRGASAAPSLRQKDGVGR